MTRDGYRPGPRPVTSNGTCRIGAKDLNKKRPREIPVYRLDEHNEAYFYWQKARIEGILKGPLDLFHVDAHADMGRPSSFRTPLHPSDSDVADPIEYFRTFSRDELSIGNFIYPGVLSGLVKNVHFIYPEWRQFKPKRAVIQIASVFGEGKLIKYPAWLARETHQKSVDKALPDLKTFSYLSHPVGRMPRKRKVILDIDLDYFACRDSVQNNWEYRLEITREQYLNKDAFLSDGTIPFSQLEFSFRQDDQRYGVVISFRKTKDQVHLPDKDEIERDVDTLVNTMVERGIKPILVTLCRSRISGYCPAEYGGPIEAVLLKKLADAYPLRLAEESLSPSASSPAGNRR